MDDRMTESSRQLSQEQDPSKDAFALEGQQLLTIGEQRGLQTVEGAQANLGFIVARLS
jgi:hypothetical protein